MDARVLWAGLELDEHGRTELERLATGARAAADRAGVEVDGGRFRPHVTVARLRAPLGVVPLGAAPRRLRRTAWRADRVDLVASYLGEGPRNRPRYETIDTFPLATLRS